MNIVEESGKNSRSGYEEQEAICTFLRVLLVEEIFDLSFQ